MFASCAVLLSFPTLLKLNADFNRLADHYNSDRSNTIPSLHRRDATADMLVKQLRGNPDLMQQVKDLIAMNAEQPEAPPPTAMATSATTPQPPNSGQISPDVWKQKITAVFEGNRRQSHSAYVAKQHDHC